MKKILSLMFILSLVLGMVMLSACGETVVPTQTEQLATTAATEATTAAPEPTTAAPTTVATTESATEANTEATTLETTVCVIPTTPTKKSLKVLAVGNSFSVDAMEYVYQIAKEVGYEEIVLGNLYIGGCSLQTHAANLRSKAKGYTYYYNTDGTWKSRGSNLATEIGAEEWDYISIQQVSGDSGRPETYEPYLTQIIDFIKEYAPNAEIFWHMTWAYPIDSDYSSFKNYGYNQTTMYNAIVSTVKTLILPREEISFVIPTGTAVQNVRTSYWGDNVSRDNLHLSYDIGRYIASMMWVKQLSGVSIDNVTWVPSGTITPRLLDTIKEAVNNAYNTPYEVTEATDKQATTIEEVMTSFGIDMSKYTALDLGLTYNAYYNSTSSSEVISAANGSTASNLAQFACTKMFKKSDLPKGTLIVVTDGHQYRPEGWKKLTSVNKSADRPGNETVNVTAVTDDWWGEFEFRAFNIAKKGNPNLSDDEMKALGGAFAILVPNDPNAEIPTLPGTEQVKIDVEQLVKAAGYDFADYEIMKYEVTFYAYYNSTSNPTIVSRAGGSTASNINQFAATSKKFTKDEIPVGSLIVLAEGYQYRPEGWVDLNTKNSSSSRPANVTTSVVEVTGEWWGSFTLRAFNIAKQGNPGLSDSEMKQLDGVMFILVPKK